MALLGLEMFLLREKTKDRARYGIYLGVAIAVLFALPISAVTIAEVAHQASRWFNAWVELVFLIMGWVFLLAASALLADAPTIPRNELWERRIAAASSTWWVPTLAAFVIVYREGVEAIVFMTLLNPTAIIEIDQLAAGIALALITLVGLYMALRYSLRTLVMLRPMLITIAGLMFLIGMHFVGETVEHLQRMGLITSNHDLVAGAGWFGASYEALIAEAVAASITVMAAVAIHWPRHRNRK